MTLTTTETPRRLLTVPEVADELRVSRTSVYRRIGDGTIPAVRSSGTEHGPLRIPRESLERFLDPGTTR